MIKNNLVVRVRKPTSTGHPGTATTARLGGDIEEFPSMPGPLDRGFVLLAGPVDSEVGDLNNLGLLGNIPSIG